MIPIVSGIILCFGLGRIYDVHTLPCVTENNNIKFFFVQRSVVFSSVRALSLYKYEQ